MYFFQQLQKFSVCFPSKCLLRVWSNADRHLRWFCKLDEIFHSWVHGIFYFYFMWHTPSCVIDSPSLIQIYTVKITKGLSCFSQHSILFKLFLMIDTWGLNVENQIVCTSLKLNATGKRTLHALYDNRE